MKSPALLRHIIAAALLLPAVAGAQSVTSAVPGFISYQGRVLNSSGGLVGTGTPVSRTVIFRIWDHPSNTLVANLLYSEAQTVTVSEGEFSVLVGTGSANPTQTFGYSETTKGPPTTSLANVFNGATRYLGVTVAAGGVIATTDNEITPRQQIVSSAFALRAKFAETLGSNGATSITTVDGGNVGVGNTNPPALFTVTGSNTGTSSNAPQLAITDSADTNERLVFGVDGTGNSTGFIQATKVGTGAQNLLLNPNGGNVGIGMSTAPTGKLDVAGGIKASGTGGHTFNTGDLDGGLFSPVDGVVTLQTNGSERVRVDGTGNVGIGTALMNAGRKLTLGGAGGICIGEEQTAGTTSLIMSLSAVTNGYANIQAVKNQGGSLGDIVLNGGGGNVGIGMTAPPQKLSISNGVIYQDAINGWEDVFQIARGGVVKAGISMDVAGTSLRLFTGASSATPRLTISAGGNVGIGTTSPGRRLHVGDEGVSGSVGVIRVGHNNGAGSFRTWDFGIGDSSIFGATDNFGFRDLSGGTIMTMQSSGNGGNVGIGTTSPTQAKLVVNGGGANFALGQQGFLNSTTPTGTSGSSNGPLSIYATNDVASTTFRAFSDARIKLIQGLSDGGEDLAHLRGIQVTDYLYKDKVSKSNRPQKKVIAQQVEKVFPQAVGEVTDVVPDIYAQASFQNGWVELKTDLKKGERVRLTDDKTTNVFEVLEVKPGKFRTAFKPEGDKVFVYGREVKDFRTVDYEAISMLNVSATQELARKVETLEKDNAEKDSALTAMTKRLAALEAKDKARDAKLAAIEAMLSGEKTAALPVSLKKNVGGAE